MEVTQPGENATYGRGKAPEHVPTLAEFLCDFVGYLRAIVTVQQVERTRYLPGTKTLRDRVNEKMHQGLGLPIP